MEKTKGARERICVRVGTGSMGLENLDRIPCQMVVPGRQNAWVPVPAQLSAVLPGPVPFLSLSILICIMGPCRNLSTG